MVIALVAFPAANFGGYLLGTLIGIVGAALTLAWQRLPADSDVDATDAADGADEAVDDDPAPEGAGAGPAASELPEEDSTEDDPTGDDPTGDEPTEDDPTEDTVPLGLTRPPRQRRRPVAGTGY